jgi:sugar phosphate permease
LGGIIGSLIMGVLSDVLVARSPVHLLGCIVGAICLSMLTTVRDQNHTLALTWLLTLFNVFENGATIVIAIIICDIGKDQVI